jgi:hypothetical protein
MGSCDDLKREAFDDELLRIGCGTLLVGFHRSLIDLMLLYSIDQSSATFLTRRVMETRVALSPDGHNIMTVITS